MQESNDTSWKDEKTQRGVNKDILTESLDPRCRVLGLLNDFFETDVIGPSYIPSQSEPYTYNFESSSQYGLQTPPPMHESQTQEEEGSTVVVFVNTDPLLACHLSVVGKGQLAVVA